MYQRGRSRADAWTTRRRLAPAVLAATAMLAFGGLVSTASAAHDAGEWLERTSPPEVALARVPPEHRDEVVIRSVVTSPRFANTYAGDVGRDDGGTTIYATRAGMAQLAGALERELGPPESSTYELRPATLSYKALDALTTRINDDWELLDRAGVRVVAWGPDPATNTVRAEIADYTPGRARLVRDRFGDDVTVVQATVEEPMVRFAVNRFYDSPNFYNGILIRPSNQTVPPICTHSFAVRGYTSGTRFGLTAGHCGGKYMYTNENVFYQLGAVSTNYFALKPNGGFDLLSFRCESCSYTGKVWIESWAARNLNGFLRRAAEVCTWCDRIITPRERVAVDGAMRGQVPHNDVITRDYCFYFTTYETERYTRTCHLNRSSNPAAYENGTKVCGTGDSGGPVYQRDGSSADIVYPAGVLVGGNGAGWLCLYHDMTRVLRHTGTTLLTDMPPTP